MSSTVSTPEYDVLLGKFILGAIAVIIGLIVSALWGGYVLSVVWGWFVVPTFHLPPLTLAPAIGLRMVVGFLVYQPRGYSKVDSRPDRPFMESFGIAMGLGFFLPALTLCFGWVIHLFM